MAVSAVKSGLAVLQQGHLYRRNEFVFLLLLSTGLERIMKVILHLHAYETQGAFSTRREMRDAGHALSHLCALVVARCFVGDYLRRSIAQSDHAFITQDPLLGEVLATLTAFAKDDRYLYLDSIADVNLPNAADRWPSRRWNALETALIAARGEDVSVDQVERQQRDATHDLVVLIERFMRALGRLFAFGVLGEGGRRVSSSIGDFTRLGDDQLGANAYPV